MRVLLLALLALTPLLAGCSLVDEPEARELAGPTDGYTPTNAYLKLALKRDDGTTALLAFDRRDWYAAKIAELVDERQLSFVSAQALPRATLNEYEPQVIRAPEELAALRYDAMGASPEARQSMDDEYQALLERTLAQQPVQPTQLLPMDPIS